MGAIDCDALALVDRGGIAVIDVVVGPYIDRDAAAAVQPDRDRRALNALDRGKAAVADPELSIVLEEIQPVAGREQPRSRGRRDAMILAEGP